jgi:phage gpG-like protein
MTGVYSILGFVAKLKTIELEMKVLDHAIVARACEMIAAEARRVIGEGYDDWPALAPSTLAKKMMNTPLLETGELRGSIEWNSEGDRGEVGSNLEKAVWHELGTARIPARSFLAGAAMRMEDKIHKMAARAVMAVMLGKGLHSSEMAELLHFLHVLHHVGHKVGEAVDKALEGPDDENKGKHR